MTVVRVVVTHSWVGGMAVWDDDDDVMNFDHEAKRVHASADDAATHWSWAADAAHSGVMRSTAATTAAVAATADSEDVAGFSEEAEQSPAHC